MTHAEIYLKAAALMESGEEFCHTAGCGWSCCALSVVIGPITEESNKLYFEMKDAYIKRFSSAPWWNGPHTPENTRERIAALKAMARA